MAAAHSAVVHLCGISVPAYAYADGGEGADYGDPTMTEEAPAPEAPVSEEVPAEPEPVPEPEPTPQTPEEAPEEPEDKPQTLDRDSLDALLEEIRNMEP